MQHYSQTSDIRTEQVLGQWSSEETRLVIAAKRGDRQAIGELYCRHVERIYRYVYSRVHDRSVAEDLTSQVFLRMLEGLPHYEPSGKPFLSWLYRIACARTADYWRSEHRVPQVMLDESWLASMAQPGDLLDKEADWCMAVELLARLTDDQQDVLILRFIGEMSLVEVAQIMGKTVGATKALQHRALVSLSRLWQNQVGEG